MTPKRDLAKERREDRARVRVGVERGGVDLSRDHRAMAILRGLPRGTCLMCNGVNWRCEVPVASALFVAGEAHDPADAIICVEAKLVLVRMVEEGR